MSIDELPTLPRAHGPAAVLSAMFRSTPEDFFVEELPSFEPSGSGEHLLLTVEKRRMNTAFVARRIAHWAGVPEAAIGFAGLKDRHAVTRQRFTVHLPRKKSPEIAALEFADAGSGESLRVLAWDWHSRKLPRGALNGNRFVLMLRDVAGERDAIEQRLRTIALDGVPNYFGEQRFGRDGDNVANALAMFAGRRMRREQRSLLLSAARSELFNRVLASRIQDGSWTGLRDGHPLEGEVWSLEGSRSVFGPEPFTETLAERLAAFDIHPTGPLWGRGELRSRGEVAALEERALSGGQALALRAGLEAAGLAQERRALRVRAADLCWRWDGSRSLELAFALPAGAYATAVLTEIGALTTSVPR